MSTHLADALLLGGSFILFALLGATADATRDYFGRTPEQRHIDDMARHDRHHGRRAA